MLNLVLELVKSLARAEGGVDGGKDESKGESVDLRLDKLGGVEHQDVEEGSTGIAGEGEVAVELHARRHDVGSDDGNNGENVDKEELSGVARAGGDDQHSNDEKRDVVKEVRSQVDPQTVEELTCVLGQPVLGVKVVLLHLIEIHGVLCVDQNMH